jgi:hypothetical protein
MLPQPQFGGRFVQEDSSAGLCGKVTLLRHALRLSQASGIPIEKFVGGEEGERGEK